MAKFGKRSLGNLSQVDPVLQVIMRLAIKEYDFSIICGHRGKEDQDKAFGSGNSKVRWPQSKHNNFPSLAVDIIPYPAGYKASKKDWYYMAGVIKGVVSMLNGWSIRWGGCWKDDTKFDKNKFNDLAHFELVKEK